MGSPAVGWSLVPLFYYYPKANVHTKNSVIFFLFFLFQNEMTSHSRSIAICAKPQLQTSSIEFIPLFNQLSLMWGKDLFKNYNSFCIPPRIKKLLLTKKTLRRNSPIFRLFSHVFIFYLPFFPTSKKKNKNSNDRAKLFISNLGGERVPYCIRAQLVAMQCRSGECIKTNVQGKILRRHSVSSCKHVERLWVTKPIRNLVLGTHHKPPLHSPLQPFPLPFYSYPLFHFLLYICDAKKKFRSIVHAHYISQFFLF